MEPNANVTYNPGQENFQQVDTDNDLPHVKFAGSNISRDRPFSASMVSRTTTGSTPSRTSRATNIKHSKDSLRNFFSYRVSVLNYSYIVWWMMVSILESGQLSHFKVGPLQTRPIQTISLR